MDLPILYKFNLYFTYMFPLYDSSERSTFPFINFAIIAVNIFVFYLQLTSPDFEKFVFDYAFTPANFNFLNPQAYIPIFTSMFMHGGLLHIASNLWFLHIFGDNVEDRMGHIRYLLFYLAAGVAATLAQYFLGPTSDIPQLGASGAISGVAGAYFVLFRHSRVRSIVPMGFYITTANLPVWLFLGYWFAIQLFSGFTTFGDASITSEGGVAWFAHIGGFVFGWLVAVFMKQKHKSTQIFSENE